MKRIVYFFSQRDQNFLRYHFVLHENGKGQGIVFFFLKSSYTHNFSGIDWEFPQVFK